MQALPLTNVTRVLATDQPEYEPLHICDMPMANRGNAMVSVWRPTEDERRRLILGGEIQLCILGEVHPPVLLVVTGGE